MEVSTTRTFWDDFFSLSFWGEQLAKVATMTFQYALVKGVELLFTSLVERFGRAPQLPSPGSHGQYPQLNAQRDNYSLPSGGSYGHRGYQPPPPAPLPTPTTFPPKEQFPGFTPSAFK